MISIIHKVRTYKNKNIIQTHIKRLKLYYAFLGVPYNGDNILLYFVKY